MMKLKSSAIIGLGFGDEGKGITTDYLCSLSSNNPLVIRFSGGQQAGHTVVLDKIRHVFSNFGSGSLRNIPTYWSKYCTFDPITLINELDVLKKKGINPILYVDANSPITTPYDTYSNHLIEKTNNHGSCGLGIGTTINREENHYSLTFSDIFYPSVLHIKLEAIRKYYGFSIKMIRFYECIQNIIQNKNIILSYGIPKGFNEYIFEGSQGLLLDQNIGFFPNVTRGNTSTKNILEMGFKPELFLITRAYQTRHGNGPMTKELFPNNITIDPNETNVYNDYQKNFRRSLLDLDLLLYGINKDEYIRTAKNKWLVITCMDHVENEFRLIYNGVTLAFTNENEFIEKISNILGIKNIIISKTNESKNMYYFK